MSVTSLDARTRRELTAFHRLLTLEDAPGPEDLEWWLFPELDTASPFVVRICRVTDRLSDLLAAVDPKMDSRRRHDPTDSQYFIQA